MSCCGKSKVTRVYNPSRNNQYTLDLSSYRTYSSQMSSPLCTRCQSPTIHQGPIMYSPNGAPRVNIQCTNPQCGAIRTIYVTT